MKEPEIIDDFYLKFPCSLAVLGSSRSGKTQFLTRLLTRLDEVASDYLPISKLVLCYDTHQSNYDKIIEHLEKQFPGVEILTFDYYPEEKLSDPSFFEVPAGTMTVLILDDLTDQIKPSFEKLLRKTSHHQRVTVLMLSQESSGDPKIVKNALRSVNYVVVMRSSQPGIFLTDLNKKYLPGQKNFLAQCFEMSTRKNSPFYPYLIIDTASINNKIRNGLFKEEEKKVYRYSDHSNK